MTAAVHSPLGPGRNLTEGGQVLRFGEKYIKQTKGRWAGEYLVWEPWQRQVINELYAIDPTLGRRIYDEGLIGVPRKNGKSTAASAISLDGLLREEGAEVYNAAGSKEQARAIFNQSKAYVEANPLLLDIFEVQKDVIFCKATGGIYRVVSAEGGLQHGLNPNLVAIDELHGMVTPAQVETIEALRTAGGARENPLTLYITTAGFDQKSELYRLYTRGMSLLAKGGPDALREAGFFFRWFSAPQNCDHTDPAMWHLANPSSWIEDRYLKRRCEGLPESVFRRLHLNQWTSGNESWLNSGAWKACARPGIKIPLGSDVTGGIDVGMVNDCTSFVICGKDPATGRAIAEAHIWEPPEGEDFDFNLLYTAVFEAVKKYRVRSIGYDDWAFSAGAQALAEKGVPMVMKPMSNARMVPDSKELRADIDRQEILYDPDAEHADKFSEHVLAGVVKQTERGWKISKDKAKSPIDALIALVLARSEQRATPTKTVSKGAIQIL